MRKLALRNAQLHAEILPGIGGALARLDAVAGGAVLPVLRRFGHDTGTPRPNQLACFPLVPWSNRLAGGFSWEGRSYAIAPNRDGDPYPMHGEGWLLPWEVVRQSGTEAVLELDRSAGETFAFRARMTYRLDGSALIVTLEAVNAGALALPFGLGLHPWMQRGEGVRLQAAAKEVWLAGPDKLPQRAAAIPEAWSFAQARELPAELVDHVFEGWDGKATITWPQNGLSLTIESDCGYFILYTPPGKDFFCFEPVDHRIDAHNGEGGPERHGLTVLAPGQKLERQFRFVVSE